MSFAKANQSQSKMSMVKTSEEFRPFISRDEVYTISIKMPTATDLDQVDLTLQKLRAWMSSFSSTLVAYSGGVDSALVLALAHEAGRSLGCIGVSPSYPRRELEAAVGLVDRLGIPYRLIDTQEHLDPQYAANPSNRCYFCKSELYSQLASIAAETGMNVILDGTNASDLQAHRPGYAAAREHGVRSPLAELGITKAMVRQIARRLDLPVAEKPASPCLASRVPTGVAIVPQLLSQIEKAEDLLASLGFSDFRVRHHGEVARIELPIESLLTAIHHREAIVIGVKAAGYRFVSLDLAGLKSGSLSDLSAGPAEGKDA